ncbi:MAG: HAD-IG family 5'-nucleotidase [Actinomycetota bacterium]|nr:HAD-IG family 5'-nucleotidase [Actinomycetota bacterium]
MPESPSVARRVSGPSVPARRSRVFCSRSLRMDQVAVVGFDMDYTLAVYHQPEMDQLSVRLTRQRMVERGWPEWFADLPDLADYPIRGLLVDTRYGNVLKMDRHRYVKRAYHGTRELSRDERRALYETRRLRPGNRRYHWVDTLYALAEVSVYAAAVDEYERRGIEVDHEELFRDVRASIDEAHGSGEVFRTLASDFDRYVVRDPRLGATLHRLRSSGKRLFLLTNSGPEATDALMTHLLDGALDQYPSWRRYFDVIVTSARKPLWFTGREPFLGESDDGWAPVSSFRRGRLYQGGNIAEFESVLGARGDEILYVGDHIYGDVLRANVQSGWRTCMIIQEMVTELAALSAHGDELDAIERLDEELAACHDELRLQRAVLDGEISGVAQLHLDWDGPDASPEELDRRQRHVVVEGLLGRIRSLEERREELEERVASAYHPWWGSLFWAGSELSSFGAQVEQYAWLYTDRVSNLAGYSPLHYFRSPRGRMVHEL